MLVAVLLLAAFAVAACCLLMLVAVYGLFIKSVEHSEEQNTAALFQIFTLITRALLRVWRGKLRPDPES